MQLRERGFTLIELMVSMAIGLVLGTTFFSVMGMQTLTYLERLDEVDANQNARAAMNMIRRYVSNTRFGLAQDANGGGVVAIGRCYSSSNSQYSQGNCHNLSSDNGADRMRLIFLQNDSDYVGDTTYGSAQNCTTNSFVGATYLRTNTNPGTPFTSASLNGLGYIAGIGGSCYNPNIAVPSGSDVVFITSDAGAGDNCLHRYAYTLLEGNSSLACVNGYAANFSFGHAVVADFYVLNDSQGRPQLMMRNNPTLPVAQGFVVAFNVEDFEVTYGIDTSLPTDRAVDTWCADPRIVSDGGTCNTGYTTNQNYNRIVAVKVTLRVRTGTPRPRAFVNPISPNNLIDNPVVNMNDGYRRWVYTTTINLRNDNI